MKNIILLLFVPSLMFMTVAAFTFFESWVLQNTHTAIHNGSRIHDCEAFIARVLAVKQGGTPEQYQHALQDQQWAINAEGDLSNSIVEDLRFAGWIAIFAVIAQFAAIYRIWQKLHKEVSPSHVGRQAGG